MFLPFFAYSQVGIGTTNPDASLDLRSSNQATPANTDGLLVPKIDAFPATNPGANQNGMLVYLTTNTTFSDINYSENFHYWYQTNSRWVPITSIELINDLIDGKSDVDGTEDSSSVYLGINAGANDDSSDNKNVAIGYYSLRQNTTGRRNTSIGHLSLSQNLTGNNNTAIGGQALNSNTSGNSNIAIGAFFLTNNTSGLNNVTAGNQSMRYNDTGGGNTAFGDYALKGDLDDVSPPIGTGNFNVAFGNQALEGLATGNINVAIGYQAGFNKTNDNRLYIENSDNDADTALLYGEFDNDILRVNGTL